MSSTASRSRFREGPTGTARSSPTWPSPAPPRSWSSGRATSTAWSPTRPCRRRGGLEQLQLGGGQASAPGQLRVAHPDGARDRARSWRRRARATWSSSPRSRARWASPRSALYSATKFGLRGFALRAARGHAASRRRRLDRLARLRARARACSPTPRSKPPPGLGTTTPEKVAQAVVRAIRRNRNEITVGAAAPALPRRDRLPPPGVRGAASSAAAAPSRSPRTCAAGQSDKR